MKYKSKVIKKKMIQRKFCPFLEHQNGLEKCDCELTYPIIGGKR